MIPMISKRHPAFPVKKTVSAEILPKPILCATAPTTEGQTEGQEQGEERIRDRGQTGLIGEESQIQAAGQIRDEALIPSAELVL